MLNNILNIFKFKNYDNKYFINLLSYFLFTLSNLVFLILIPYDYAKSFFIHYSVASGIFSYFVVLLFSKKKNLEVKYLLFLAIFGTIYSNFFESLILLIWVYTLVIIYADYFFSQKKYIKTNFFIKFFLLVLSCLLFIDQMSIFLVMNIKIIFLLICIIIFYVNKIHSSYPLEFKHPNLYVFSTCLIYFGSLYLIAYLSLDEFIKLFYISFQIFLSIKLKIFDLGIRGILKLKKINIILFISGSLYFILFSIYTTSYFIMILFLITYFTLEYVKRKFIQI